MYIYVYIWPAGRPGEEGGGFKKKNKCLVKCKKFLSLFIFVLDILLTMHLGMYVPHNLSALANTPYYCSSFAVSHQASTKKTQADTLDFRSMLSDKTSQNNKKR